MGFVLRNLPDMPVPSFAYTDRNDGRVFVIQIEDGVKHKKTIGHMTDSTPGKQRMVPNSYFQEKYQNLFNEHYPTVKIPPHEIHIGMYALTLGIVQKTGLYKVLIDTYGPLFANSILDYAMFSVMYKTTVTQLFEEIMNNKVIFSDKLHKDSWYSDFFSNKLTEDSHLQFKVNWIKQLKNNGLKKVWLAIDGSNNDCEARQSFLAKFGFPKSHNQNKTIVGYMYVVDAATGQPVTYFVYEGSVPDCQAFHTVATFLKSFDIEIEGVILNRGFAVESVFKAIDENKWKYVIMLPSDTYAHKNMQDEYGDVIRWKSEHLVDDTALFGISSKQKIFGNHDRESTICLYFDGAKGSNKSIKLIKQIQAAKKKTEQR